MRERRFISHSNLRSIDSEKPTIVGYASVFGEKYDSGWFVETIKPGAFTRALTEKHDVRALLNHDPNLLLGRTESNTLSLREDSKGLQFECTLPETQTANEVRTLIKRGDLSGCSFAFRVTKQTWRDDENPETKQVTHYRDIEDLDLYDISVVTYPAYEGTSVGARSLFPEGIPAEVRAHVPELREMKPGAAMGDTPSDQGDGNTDPDNDGDDDTTPAGDTDQDYYQRSADHHDMMGEISIDQSTANAETASMIRSAMAKRSKRDEDGDDMDTMKECMSATAGMCEKASDHNAGISEMHYERATTYRSMMKDGGRSAQLPTEQRDKKTKRVAGEDLPASAFAYVGDPEKTETWKLPIKFSSDAKTKAHIRNALARFSQTQGIPSSERDKVLAKIKAAARKYGIDVADDEKKSNLISLEQAKAKVATLEASLTQ